MKPCMVRGDIENIIDSKQASKQPSSLAFVAIYQFTEICWAMEFYSHSLCVCLEFSMVSTEEQC